MVKSGGSNRFGTVGSLRRGRGGRVGVASPIAIGLAAAVLVLAGCGSEEPTIGASVEPTTTTTIPITTSTAVATTTIDFDRPVDQGVEPLAADAGPTEIGALVEEIRGQTRNIAVQMRRLAPFPGLPGPTLAQIMDVTVVHRPEIDEAYPSVIQVRYRTPEPGPAMVKAINDELRAQSWYQSDGTATPTDDGELTEMVFLISGTKPEELELVARVEAGPGPTVVELVYTVAADEDDAKPTDDDDTYLDLLSAWQEDLPLPRSAELVQVEVTTSPEIGSLGARYTIEAEDETEAVALVAAAVASSDYELLDATADEPPTAGPLRLVDADGTIVVLDFSPGDEEIVELEATTGFPLTPLD